MLCFFIILKGEYNMTITFAEIGKFISDNLLWFLIPINIAILTFLVILIVKESKAKKRRKNERERQDKLSKSTKKTHKL